MCAASSSNYTAGAVGGHRCGKASAAVARAVEDHWSGPLSGLVVTRYGYKVACERTQIVEAAHPVPDVAGELAAKQMLQLVQGLTSDDLVLCLISGGGSALLPLPLAGIARADKQALSRELRNRVPVVDLLGLY